MYEDEVYRPREIGYPELTEDVLLEEFCIYITEISGITVSQKYRLAIRDMIYGFLTAKENELTVIPAMMGLGKSTLLQIFIKCMAMNHTDFGCIVVKERIEDVKMLAKELGDNENEYEPQRIAYPWKGFNELTCKEGYTKEEFLKCNMCQHTECETKKARQSQIYYPVVVITHERLFRKANSDHLLENLRYWIDFYEKKHERKFVFVDEMPKFFDTATLTEGDLVNFSLELSKLNKSHKLDIGSKEIKTRGQSYFNTFHEGQFYPFNDDEMIKLLHSAQSTWWKYYEGKHPEIFNTVLDFFSGGGLYFNSCITTYRWTDFRFQGYKTVILDGTAKEDITYKPFNPRIIDIDDFRKYDNVTIWHHNQRNMSKSRLKKGDNLKDYVPEIENIAHFGLTLVACHKKYEGKLQELLSHIPNVVIGHFNALKGSNEFRECTNIVFMGTMDFVDEYYILKALGINKELVTSFETETNNRRHYFKCDFINEVERNTQECNMLQDIFRIAIRQQPNNSPINVYIINTNNQLVQNVKNRLPGSTLKSWTPHNFQGIRQQKILEYLSSHLVNKGDCVAKSEVRNQAAVSKDDLKELLKHPLIQEFLIDNNITGAEPGNMSRKLCKE